MAAAALLPLVPAAAAFAADNVICVGNPAGPCNENAASISAAIIAADANNVDDTILVGPGTYSDGPYYLDGSVHAVTLKGAGQDATFLTLPAAASMDVYVLANGAAVQDLTIKMAAATSLSDTGLDISNNSTAVAVRSTAPGRRTRSASTRRTRQSRCRRSRCPRIPAVVGSSAEAAPPSPTAGSVGEAGIRPLRSGRRTRSPG